MSRLIPYGKTRMTPFWGPMFDDRFFRSFFDMNDFNGASGFKVSIKDKKDFYELEAELPGAAEDQIEIEVLEGLLTISANVDVSQSEEKDDYIYSERRRGRFQRSFNVENVKEDEITASYKNGILLVNLPKKEEEKPSQKRRIAIN